MLARAVLALSLAVRVYDNTGVPPGDRATALAAAHDILKDAGIAVTWRDDDNVPARQGMAIMAGVRAVIDSFRGLREASRRRTATRAAVDEEESLFIG